jgi:Domain of unknown function (DUF397)
MGSDSASESELGGGEKMQNPAATNRQPDNAQIVWRRPRACANSECVEVAALADEVAMRCSRSPDLVLTFTKAEWGEFLRGAKAGDFDEVFGAE